MFVFALFLSSVRVLFFIFFVTRSAIAFFLVKFFSFFFVGIFFACFSFLFSQRFVFFAFFALEAALDARFFLTCV